MNEGKIEKHGVDNIKAIATLIEEQNIQYNFQYYQQDLPVNVSVLVIGSGRSMFKNTLQVPAKSQNFKVNEVREKVN